MLTSVEWLSLGYEIVDCPFPEWKFQPADLVAAFGFHAGLVVGAPTMVTSANAASLAAQLGEFKLKLFKNDTFVEEGGGKNVLRNPALCLGELAAAIRRSPWAEPLRAGRTNRYRVADYADADCSGRDVARGARGARGRASCDDAVSRNPKSQIPSSKFQVQLGHICYLDHEGSDLGCLGIWVLGFGVWDFPYAAARSTRMTVPRGVQRRKSPSTSAAITRRDAS